MTSKKNTAYWQNKIVYALSKIDYAKAQINNTENINERSKIFSVLLQYGGKTKVTTIEQLTKLPQKVIVPVLQELRNLRIVEWSGRLGKFKEVKAKKDLKVVYEGVKGKFTEKIVGYGFDEKGGLIHPDDFVNGDAVVAKPKEQIDEGWVEVDYSDDVKLRVRKEKLKKALL